MKYDNGCITYALDQLKKQVRLQYKDFEITPKIIMILEDLWIDAEHNGLLDTLSKK